MSAPTAINRRRGITRKSSWSSGGSVPTAAAARSLSSVRFAPGSERSITYVMVGEQDVPYSRDDAELVLANDGSWTQRRIDDGQAVYVASGKA